MLPSSNKSQRNGGRISGGMSTGVAIFGRIWRVDFDQPYLLIGGESKVVILVNQASSSYIFIEPLHVQSEQGQGRNGHFNGQ
jgi:hypothetical protein